MGKTHRNVNAGSNSIDYHSPHNRGFAKDKKQYTHKQIRNSNKICDEDTFQTMKHISGEKKMKEHFASGYRSKIGNIPNKPDFLFTDEYLENNYGVKWDKHNDKTPLDTINRVVNIDPVFKMCKKQIERRGNVGLFYGHHN